MALGVTVDFNANIARFTTQVDRIAGDLDRFQRHAETMSGRVNKAFGALGVGISAAGIVSFVKSGIDALDTLNDMSIKTGIAVEKLAGFQLVTKQSGTDMDAFTRAANKLNIEMGKDSEAFKQLGIDAKDPADAFIQLADVLSKVEDPQQRAALGAKILSKSWAEMAPTLLMGGDALRAAVKEGTDMSGVTAKMAAEADKFNDQIEVMNQRVSSIATKAGGEFAEGFNQLIEKIDTATQSGITFNNVMMGIGDFAFQNAFDSVDRIGTISKEVNAINDKIVKAREGVQVAKKRSNNELLVRLGDNSEAIDAEQKLNDLLLQRDQLLIHLSESRQKLNSTATGNKSGPSQKTIEDFIGGGAGDFENSGGKKSSAVRIKQSAGIKEVTSDYDRLLEQMNREIALSGEVTEAAKIEYEIKSGFLKNATEAQQLKLLQLAAEQDNIKINTALYEEQNSIIEEGLQLAKQQQDDISANNARLNEKFNGQLLDLNAGIADVADAKNLGIIDEAKAKIEFDKLGKAYNESFIDPAKKANDDLSEFARQAARNMQTSFANFLFDPFAKDTQSMLDGFVTSLRQMAAQAASKKIMESLFGNIGSKDTIEGLLGSSDSSVGDLFSMGSGSGMMDSLSSLFSFSDGGIMSSSGPLQLHKYAMGGVANSPQLALFGEGRSNEAFVPLPDGRRIPVALQGGGNSGGGHTIIVNVQSGSAPDVRRAAGQGAREALGMINGAGRYG